MWMLLIKQFFGGLATKAVIYALKKWIFKIPDWGKPEEVRQSFLIYAPTMQMIARGTSIDWDDKLTEKLTALAANRAAFNIIYVAAVEALAATKRILPEEEKEERRGIIRRILGRRRDELEAAVEGTALPVDDAAELATAVVSLMKFVKG